MVTKIVKKLLILATFLIGYSANAFMDEFNPYVGVEALWSAKQGGNIFLGGKFCDNWGAEIGYSHTAKQTESHNEILGSITVSSKTHHSFNQFYVDLNGYWPFPWMNGDLNFIGSIGIGALNPRLRVDSVVINGTVVPTPNPVMKHKTKSTLRLGVGAQWMVTECLGVRGLVRWVTTPHFYATTTTPANVPVNITRPLGNYVILSAGIFWRF